jgi:hypothetical protein
MDDWVSSDWEKAPGDIITIPQKAIKNIGGKIFMVHLFLSFDKIRGLWVKSGGSTQNETSLQHDEKLEVIGGRFEATGFLPPTSRDARGVTILKPQTTGPGLSWALSLYWVKEGFPSLDPSCL